MRPSRKQIFREVWSAKWIAALLLLTGLTSTALVFILGEARPWLAELRTSVAIFAGMQCLFLFAGLYRGVQIHVEEMKAPTFNLGQSLDLVSDSASVPDGIDVGGDEGCLGVILGIVLAIVFCVLLALFMVLLWEFAFVPLLFAMYGLFCMALRSVFKHSAACHGNIGTSLRYAMGFSLLYSGWLWLAVYAAQKWNA
jgi:hypothetical protein